MKRIAPIALLLLLTPAITLAQEEAASEESACISCHGNADFMGEEGVQLVAGFRQGVHLDVGLSCHDCHGGNPDPSLADDPEASMDTRFAPSPFVGTPAREKIPSFCGTCHSDPVYMRQYKPDVRIDQEREYWTSRHGQALRKMDRNVATCSDCHGVHGTLRPSNPRSRVYPTNVAQTCRTCHADLEKMAGYTGPDGKPIRIDQYARWRQSVHANAMFEKKDLSAPTCNDCHGNHGAAPPGLESVAFVCGQCHGRESNLFRGSSKHDALEVHNEFLADAGEDSCAACHEDKPRGDLPMRHSFGECSSCHGNHGIVRPTTAMLAPPPDTPCAFCHEISEELLEEYPELQDEEVHYAATKVALLQQGRTQNLDGSDLFDWLVEAALTLPDHTLQADEGQEAVLRPEFSELFQKFRIGKTFYTYADPATGQLVRASVVRCSHCHSDEEDSMGMTVGRGFLDRMQQLTALGAAAERTLLKARRAGMETREAMLEVDQAVNAQIALAALIHNFEVGDEFLGKHEEGLEHAREALVAGRQAHHELQIRRLGLAVALILILLVLVGLGLKIRQVSQREAELHS